MENFNHELKIIFGDKSTDTSILIDDQKVELVHDIRILTDLEKNVQEIEIVFADVFNENQEDDYWKKACNYVQNRIDILKMIPNIKISFIPIYKMDNNNPGTIPEVPETSSAASEVPVASEVLVASEVMQEAPQQAPQEALQVQEEDESEKVKKVKKPSKRSTKSTKKKTKKSPKKAVKKVKKTPKKRTSKKAAKKL
jgi:hypothetical protein